MKTIGIIGAGEVGSHIASAAIAVNYDVVISNSRGPETLTELVRKLGSKARAATPEEAARAGDFVVIAVPLKLKNNMPTEALSGKIVIDTNNYMNWRDGNFPVIDSGEKTVHELRQEQLTASKLVKALTHIQAPRILKWARPKGEKDRVALAASSNYPEAVKLVSGLYDEFGFDSVNNSPLSESWRTAPGQPAWKQERHNEMELIKNLRIARRLFP